MDIPVCAPGQIRVLTLDGVEYRVRALTYGQVTEIQLAGADRPRPSEAAINDAIKKACVDAGRGELAAGIDEYEEAQDSLTAIFADIPSNADPEGREKWASERVDELTAANRALSRAKRKRDAAVYIGEQDETVRRMRRELVEMGWGDVVATVAAALGKSEAEVRDMPAHHVTEVNRVAREMTSPTVSAAKN